MWDTSGLYRPGGERELSSKNVSLATLSTHQCVVSLAEATARILPCTCQRGFRGAEGLLCFWHFTLGEPLELMAVDRCVCSWENPRC